MPEFKRVKLDESGAEVTVAHVREGMTVIDKPATSSSGVPLAPKYKTTVDQAAANRKTTSGGESAKSKEDSK